MEFRQMVGMAISNDTAGGAKPEVAVRRGSLIRLMAEAPANPRQPPAAPCAPRC